MLLDIFFKLYSPDFEHVTSIFVIFEKSDGAKTSSRPQFGESRLATPSAEQGILRIERGRYNLGWLASGGIGAAQT